MRPCYSVTALIIIIHLHALFNVDISLLSSFHKALKSLLTVDVPGALYVPGHARKDLSWW